MEWEGIKMEEGLGMGEGVIMERGLGRKERVRY